MQASATIEIARPREEVWAFVVDHSNDPAWCREVLSVERLGARRWRVTHRPVPLRAAVTLSLEHLEHEPPAHLTLREEDDASVFTVCYMLEPTPTGTRMTQVSEFEWKSLPRPLRPLFARGVRGDLRRQLRDLRHNLESRVVT